MTLLLLHKNIPLNSCYRVVNTHSAHSYSALTLVKTTLPWPIPHILCQEKQTLPFPYIMLLWTKAKPNDGGGVSISSAFLQRE